MGCDLDDLGNTGSVAVVSNVRWYSPSFGRTRRGPGREKPGSMRPPASASTSLTVLAAVLAETVGEISNAVHYVVPIASVIFVSTAILTPIIDRSVGKATTLYLGLSLSITTLAAGTLMAINEVGFTEPPSLSLPPPP